MSAQDYAKEVADRVIEQLEQGTAPWVKPWEPGTLRMPYNPTTDKPYRGINSLWLSMQGRSDPRWLTYKQAGGLGAQVQKGQKGSHIEYWKFREEVTKRDENGKPVLDEKGQPQKVSVELDRPRRFTAVVFNAEQIDGLAPLSDPVARPAMERHDQAEAILANSGARIRHQNGDRAYYSPGTDQITLPETHQFKSPDAYYSTALHELGHWTGHPTRLDRDLSNPFGSEGYAKEELRAEIASMMLGEQLGIGHDPGQHVAYIGSWIKALKEDPREIFRAAADADKISRYVTGLEHVQQQQAEVQAEQQPTPSAEADPLVFFINGRDEQTYTSPSEAVAQFEKVHRGMFPLTAARGDQSLTLIGHHHAQDGSHSFAYNAVPIMARLHEAVKKGSEAESMALDAVVLDVLEGSPILNPNLAEQAAQSTAPRESKAMPEAPLTTDRTYLAVPYSEKEQAKAVAKAEGFRLGWDKEAKSWYAPEGVSLQNSGLSRWIAKPAKPDPKPIAQAPEQAFADELRRHGLVMDGAPIMNGKLHRVPVEGDKGSERSGAYVGHLDGVMPAGFIQNHKTGEANNWRMEGKGVAPLTEREKAEAQAVAAANKQRREVGRVEAQEKAATAGRILWGEADPAQDTNAYCVKKAIVQPAAKGLRQVPAQVSEEAEKAGIRIAVDHKEAKSIREQQPDAFVFQKGDLLVPLFNEQGTIEGIQQVNPWFKGFLKGARKAGLYSVAGGDPSEFHAAMKNGVTPIVIGEGYATGDTVAGALGHPVIVALDSGNIDAVAHQIRKDYPDRHLIIAADNDPKIVNGKPKNVGVEKATDAARKHGGGVVVPEGIKGSDWNDYAAERGKEKAAADLKEKIEKAKAESSIATAKAKYYAHERIADAYDNPATAADNAFVAGERDKAQSEIGAATGRDDTIRANLSNASTSSLARHQQAGRDQIKEQRMEVLDGTSNSPEQDPKALHDPESKRSLTYSRSLSRSRGR